jgi:cytochrome c-type biogenesis protein CcmF
VGPLLAWRKTSAESLRKNFLIPGIVSIAVGITLVIGGVKPWVDINYFYALVALMLATLVAATIASEFLRGGHVMAVQRNTNLLNGMWILTRRNTRRYGGYIVHLGVVFVIVGFAGAAFYTDVEREMGFNDKLQIGAYTLVCKSYTQDDKPNYASESAIMEVWKGNKLVDTLYPERRVYKASEQPATIVALRSTVMEDVYLVYTGKNPDTGKPIIKAHLNPLVWWIWSGAHILLIGTIVALFPNMQAGKVAIAARERARALEEVRRAGTPVTGD